MKKKYQILNEQRTRGEIIVNGNNSIDIQVTGDNKDAMYPLLSLGVVNTYGYTKEASKANAEYIALAANNLQVLAEALQYIVDWSSFEGHPMHTKAKLALEKIS
jgi:hypothetical protein